MATATSKGYQIKKLPDVAGIQCPCGVSTRLLTSADGAPCSLHVTAIHDAARHYHKETTEVYYILAGAGKIELNDDWHDLEPGTAIRIEPGTRHRVVSEAGITTIVFGIPAFNPDDEWFD